MAAQFRFAKIRLSKPQIYWKKRTDKTEVEISEDNPQFHISPETKHGLSDVTLRGDHWGFFFIHVARTTFLQLKLGWNYVTQQDNDPNHTSKSTTELHS